MIGIIMYIFMQNIIEFRIYIKILSGKIFILFGSFSIK